jgi:ketosteroid isomerase-like protein
MKTHVLLALVGLATGLITPAFTQEQDAVAPEVPQQLEAVIAKLSEAINKHDPAAVAALCTPAGIVITPVGLFSGQQDIEKCYTGVFQRFKLSDQVEKINHVYKFGRGEDLCALTRYTNTANGGPGGGWRIIVFIRDGDTWKIRNMIVQY